MQRMQSDRFILHPSAFLLSLTRTINTAALGRVRSGIENSLASSLSNRDDDRLEAHCCHMNVCMDAGASQRENAFTHDGLDSP